MPETSDSAAVLAQFNLLMEELLQGSLQRSRYRPWEIEILLDLESCHLSDSAKLEALRKYQRVVQGHLTEGAHLPQRFAEYLEQREATRAQRKPAKRISSAPVKPKTRVR